MVKRKISREELLNLSNQMVNLRSSIETNHLNLVFKKVDLIHYSLIKRICPDYQTKSDTDKIYLKEISTKLNVTIPRASKIVQELNGKGLVIWEHDKQGTYITLPVRTLKLMSDQQELLITYFTKVIEKIGEEEFINIMENMKKLESIMEKEAEKL